jgi:hypothetical protein
MSFKENLKTWEGLGSCFLILRIFQNLESEVQKH